MKKFLLMTCVMMLSIGLFNLMAQEKTISGTITSADDGTTIPGVSIIVKGTSKGGITDFEGKYKITVPENAKVLVVSYVGMKSKEVEIGASTSIDIVMETDAVNLNDVVVTALGIKREKKALGYSVQDIGGEDVQKAKETNIVNSLSGKIAGVQVMGATGNIGGSSRILIRGANTIASNNQPLFVIDGMPVDNSNYGSWNQAYGGGDSELESSRDYGNAAQDINPDDIESISVLKGANAAALYGSRGANGVILITTKKGAKNKGIGVSFSSGITMSQAFEFPDLQNEFGGGAVPEFAMGADGIPIADLRTDQSWGPRLDGALVRQWGGEENRGVIRPWEAHPDNVKDFFELGVTYDNHIAIIGSNDKVNYRLSYTRSDQKGVVPKSSLKKNTATLFLEAKLTDKITAGANVSYINTQGRGRPSTGGRSDNVMYNLAIWSQRQLDIDDLKDYKYPDGTQRTWRTKTGFGDTRADANNPYWIVNEDYQTDERNRVIGNLNFSYDITDGLMLTARLGKDWYADRRQDRWAVGTRYDSKYLSDQIEFSELNTDLMLHYNKNLENGISLSANVGGNYYCRIRQRNTQQTMGGLSIAEVYSIENSNDRPLIRDDYSKKVVQGVFASASLGYKSFLFFDASVRKDWSSTLPSPHSYVYPSVGGSFVFSELLKSKILSFGKIRVGWAKAGNDTEPYRLQQTYLIGTPVGDNPMFYTSTSLNNADLKPEITTSQEIGFDLNFLDNRFEINATFYKSSTVDQIFAIDVSRTTGFARKWVNAGEVENKGIELGLNFGLIKNLKGFSWNVGLNWSKNNNEIVELLPGIKSYPMATLYPRGVYLESRVGEPFSTIYALKIKRNENGEKVIASSGAYQPSDELKKIGSVLPDWNMGLSNSFSYKGLKLNVLLDVQKGGVIFSRTYQDGLYTGIQAVTAEGNIREEGIILDGVHEDGTPNTTVLDGKLYYQLQRKTPGDHTIFDASYVKLREVSLGYSLPFAAKTPFNSINIYIVGRNLAILDKNTPDGLDPESAGNSSGNIQGREYGQLPSVRNIGFKLTLEL